jgi:hypothetical protein
MTATVRIITDRTGLYVNIVNVKCGSLEQYRHLPLGDSLTMEHVVEGESVYQATVIDLDDLYGGGQRFRQKYVRAGEAWVVNLLTSRKFPGD